VREQIINYFSGEKHAAVVVIAAALIAFVACAIGLAPRWGLRAFAITTGVFALFYLVVGVGLYWRTDSQVEQLMNLLGVDPVMLARQELLRMTKVQRNFIVIEWIELAIIISSVAAAISYKHRPAICGVALALLINAAFLLAVDLTAERRGTTYRDALSRS
jgi:hypothetical protein